MKPESKYCGNAKIIELNSGDIGMKVTISLSEFKEAIVKARTDPEYSGARYVSEKTGNEYITLAVFPLKPENVGNYRTHSVKLDTWKPDPNKQTQEQTQPKPQPQPQPVAPQNDDLPF